MMKWLHYSISTIIFISSCLVWPEFSEANVLHSMLGLPSECMHDNVIHMCTLSFTCWIQGGRHAEGCGNKWLLSCCISDVEPEIDSINGPKLNILPKIKSQTIPQAHKQNMLRRRMDANGMVECGDYLQMNEIINIVDKLNLHRWELNLK